MLRVIEWFCDRVDGVGKRMDYWIGRSLSRHLLVYLVGVGAVAVATTVLAAISTCLYLGRLPGGG